MSDIIDAAARPTTQIDPGPAIGRPISIDVRVSARDYVRLAQGFYFIFWGLVLTVLTGAQLLGNGVFQFAFTNAPSASFTVLSTTNLLLPLSNWTAVGAASNPAPGLFQFTVQSATNDPQRFYGVSSPY